MQTQGYTQTSNKIAIYTHRDSYQAWDHIFKTIVLWANMNLHTADQIKAIDFVFCHYDNSGMVKVIYETEPNYTQQKSNLCFECVRTSGSWATARDQHVKPLMKNIGEKGGRILCTNFHEINQSHEQCYIVVWYLK